MQYLVLWRALPILLDMFYAVQLCEVYYLQFSILAVLQSCSRYDCEQVPRLW